MTFYANPNANRSLIKDHHIEDIKKCIMLGHKNVMSPFLAYLDAKEVPFNNLNENSCSPLEFWKMHMFGEYKTFAQLQLDLLKIPSSCSTEPYSMPWFYGHSDMEQTLSIKFFSN